MMISIDLYCDACGNRGITTVDNGEDTWALRWECTCGSQAKRVMSAPAIKRKTHLDGNGRLNLWKKINRLEIQAAESHGDEKKAIKNEINQLKRI